MGIKRFAALALLGPFLSGCGLPEAVTVAGFVVESGSFLGTGKTVSDHALSAATDRDCSVLAGVTRSRFCEEEAGVSSVDRKDVRKPVGTPVAAMTMPPGARAAVVVHKTPQRPTRPAPVAPLIEDRWTLLVGTFEEMGAAVRTAELALPAKASISSAVSAGRVTYRVTIGAFPLNAAEDEREKIGWMASEKVRVLRICPSWMADESCISLDRVIHRQARMLVPADLSRP